MERENKIKVIQEIILNELYDAECESCTYENDLSYDCSHCRHEFCDWIVSDKYAEYVAELILKALEKE